MKRHLFVLTSLCVLMYSIAGCSVGGPDATPTPVPTATPASTPTVKPSATLTGTSTPTASPTGTDTPTATLTPAPTVTPVFTTANIKLVSLKGWLDIDGAHFKKSYAGTGEVKNLTGRDIKGL